MSFAWRRFSFFDEARLAAADIESDPPPGLERLGRGPLFRCEPFRREAAAAAAAAPLCCYCSAGGRAARVLLLLLQRADPALFRSRGLYCSSSGRGYLVFGDKFGYVHLVGRDLSVYSFAAHGEGTTHVLQVAGSELLISLGSEGEGAKAIVKVWAPNKRNIKGAPTCLNQFRGTAPSGESSDVVAVAAANDLSCLALGLEDGSVLLYRGDVARGRATVLRLSPPASLGEPAPVSGLCVDTPFMGDATLFVLSRNGIVAYTLAEAGVAENVVDFNPCAALCSTLADGKRPTDQGVAVGRDEAVYFYGRDGPGGCYVFQGPKRRIAWYKHYLVVLCAGSGGAGGGASKPGQKGDELRVYDLRNKLVAFSTVISRPVVHMLVEWGSLFVLCDDGRMLKFTERTMQTKLNILFRKNMYGVALNIAATDNLDKQTVADVHRLYADHLYAKGDVDGAMSQYLNTLGHVQPSYVIAKYLTENTLQQLALYLQSLHEESLANAGHTTLLLNCFAKMKDKQKLDAVLDNDEVSFDVEVAVRQCVRSGYVDQALTVAQKHGRHDLFLEVTLQALKDYVGCLDYIWKLPFEEASKVVATHGKTLVKALPEATTQLVQSLCTGYRQKTEEGEALGESELPRADAGAFIPLFDGHPEMLTEFLEFVIANANRGRSGDVSSSTVYNTLLELYLRGGEVVTALRPAVLLLHRDESIDPVDPVVLGASSYYFELTGYEPSAIINQPFELKGEESANTAVEDALGKSGDYHCQCKLRHADGSELTCFVSVQALALADGLDDCSAVIICQLPPVLQNEALKEAIQKLTSSLVLLGAGMVGPHAPPPP